MGPSKENLDDGREPERHSRSRRTHHERHRDRRSRSPEERERRHKKRDIDGKSSRSHDHASSNRVRSPPRRHREAVDAQQPVQLPFEARHLSKHDLSRFEPFFAYYLDIQKQKYLQEMDDREVRGRWKSFIRKWNAGELAEGWYDPEMFQRISAEAEEATGGELLTTINPRQATGVNADADVAGSDEDDYGPVLPGSGISRPVGAGIPSRQDLAVRDEMIEESRQEYRQDLQSQRKADRRVQKERLEELVPRAEAGSRERKLEKRKEVNDKMKEFREKSPGMDAGNERDLMGGGDSLQEFKQMKEREQRRKTEREIRREEFERAKQAEVEEKRRRYQEKEQGTISMLQELARQRFG